MEDNDPDAFGPTAAALGTAVDDNGFRMEGRFTDGRFKGGSCVGLSDSSAELLTR